MLPSNTFQIHSISLISDFISFEIESLSNINSEPKLYHKVNSDDDSFAFVDSPKMIHQLPEQNLPHPNRKIKLVLCIEKT